MIDIFNYNLFANQKIKRAAPEGAENGNSLIFGVSVG